jgi:hypothetical protein
MSPHTAQLLAAVLELPDEEGLEFTEALIASLRPADQPPFDASWCEVIHRRSKELRSGQATPYRGRRSSGRPGRRPVADLLFHLEAQEDYDAAGGSYNPIIARKENWPC